MLKVKPPSSLSDAGRALWVEHTSKYALRPDELVRLEMACRARDMLDRLDTAWAEMGYPMVSKGSTGQEVIHPIIGEKRVQQAQIDAILARLKLPDLDDAPTTNQNREAANSSWAPGSGRRRGA